MKVKEIIDQLHYFQKWRRGANLKQPDPTEIGKAIDGAIRELRNFQRLKVKIEKKKLAARRKIKEDDRRNERPLQWIQQPGGA